MYVYLTLSIDESPLAIGFHLDKGCVEIDTPTTIVVALRHTEGLLLPINGGMEGQKWMVNNERKMR